MLPPEYFRFFKGLEQNTRKTWFDDHRKDYETFVRPPFIELVQQTIDAIRTIEPELAQAPKDAMFRINRDIRFSKDKAPYKTHMGAHISRFGRKAMGKPGLYFEANANGGMVAGGCYMPSKEELALYRDLIMHEGKDLHKALKTKAFRDTFGELQGDRNKVLPAEFKEAAESEPLLFNKQFFWWTDIPKKVFTGSDAAKQLLSYYKAGKPVADFFMRVLD